MDVIAALEAIMHQNTAYYQSDFAFDIKMLRDAVELTGAANGTVQGNLYELDYQQHFQHIREAALPVGANRLIYESGMREIGPKEHF